MCWCLMELTKDTKYKELTRATLKPDGSGAMTRTMAAVLVQALLRQHQHHGAKDPRPVVDGWCGEVAQKPAGGPLAVPRPAKQVVATKFSAEPHEGVPEHWTRAIDDVEEMDMMTHFQMGPRERCGTSPLQLRNPVGNP